MALRSAKQQAPEVRIIPCAHDLCPNPAVLRRRLPTGWANLCRKHDEFHTQQEADKFCRDNGLDTLEKKRSYCLQKMLMFGKVDPITHWRKVLADPSQPAQVHEIARAALAKIQHREAA